MFCLSSLVLCVQLHYGQQMWYQHCGMKRNSLGRNLHAVRKIIYIAIFTYGRILHAKIAVGKCLESKILDLRFSLCLGSRCVGGCDGQQSYRLPEGRMDRGGGLNRPQCLRHLQESGGDSWGPCCHCDWRLFTGRYDSVTEGIFGRLQRTVHKYLWPEELEARAFLIAEN